MTPERLVIESMFMIPDKKGTDLPFILNNAQVGLDSCWGRRMAIPKARQLGISSYILARYLVACLSKRNSRAVVISHDQQSTEKLLARVQYYLAHFRGPKAILKHQSKNELSFPKTDSVFYVGTAGSRQFGRGDTITHLHCSEVAFWDNPKDLTAGLFQAARAGEIAVESTGNGQGNYYHKLCTRAAEGNSVWKLYFPDWLSNPEYSLEVTPELDTYTMANLDEEFDEPELVGKYGLTAGQVLWRREVLEELDYDLGKFKQEYPCTLDECFQASGSSIFTKIKYEETPKWKKYDRFLHLLEGHPAPGLSYLIGADVSLGVRRDNSVMEILCLNTLEQVGEWVSDGTDPSNFGYKLAEIGKVFNKAFIACEANNQGILTMKVLSEIYDMHLIYRTSIRHRMNDEVSHLSQWGVKTTVRTKPYIIGKLRTMLASDIVIHSYPLKSELDSFVEHEDGSMSAQQGCFDDRVMGLGIGVYAIDKAIIMTDQARMIKQEERKDPFSMPLIIKELSIRASRGGSSFAPEQVGGEITWAGVSED